MFVSVSPNKRSCGGKRAQGDAAKKTQSVAAPIHLTQRLQNGLTNERLDKLPWKLRFLQLFDQAWSTVDTSESRRERRASDTGADRVPQEHFGKPFTSEFPPLPFFCLDSPDNIRARVFNWIVFSHVWKARKMDEPLITLDHDTWRDVLSGHWFKKHPGLTRSIPMPSASTSNVVNQQPHHFDDGCDDELFGFPVVANRKDDFFTPPKGRDSVAPLRHERDRPRPPAQARKQTAFVENPSHIDSEKYPGFHEVSGRILQEERDECEDIWHAIDENFIFILDYEIQGNGERYLPDSWNLYWWTDPNKPTPPTPVDTKSRPLTIWRQQTGKKIRHPAQDHAVPAPPKASAPQPSVHYPTRDPEVPATRNLDPVRGGIPFEGVLHLQSTWFDGRQLRRTDSFDDVAPAVLWELSVVTFHAELLALDRRIHEAKGELTKRLVSGRTDFYYRVMGIEGNHFQADIKKSDPMFSSDNITRAVMIAPLGDFMKAWPNFEQECITDRKYSVVVREQSLWAFYLQTYWDYFGRVATRPFAFPDYL
jgi:hypothetical protein